MNKKKIIIGAILLVIVLIGAWFILNKSDDKPIKTEEDDKVNELLKSQQERSDSMKRALGIE